MILLGWFERDVPTILLKQYLFLLQHWLISLLCLHSLSTFSHLFLTSQPPAVWSLLYHSTEMASPSPWTYVSLFILLDLLDVCGVTDLLSAINTPSFGFHDYHSLVFLPSENVVSHSALLASPCLHSL